MPEDNGSRLQREGLHEPRISAQGRPYFWVQRHDDETRNMKGGSGGEFKKQFCLQYRHKMNVLNFQYYIIDDEHYENGSCVIEVE